MVADEDNFMKEGEHVRANQSQMSPQKGRRTGEPGMFPQLSRGKERPTGTRELSGSEAPAPSLHPVTRGSDPEDFGAHCYHD